MMKKLFKALFCVIIAFTFITINYALVNAETIPGENAGEETENKDNLGEDTQDILPTLSEEDKNEIFNELNKILESNQFINIMMTIIVSFLGSGGFFVILRLLFSKVITHFKTKTNEALKNNEILKEEYQKKVKQLECLQDNIDKKLNEFEVNINKLCSIVQEKLKLDEEKKKQADAIIKNLIDGDKK